MSEHICPTCNKDGFNSERAMKIHHSTSHGDSIAKEKTNCNICGTEFSYYPSDKKGLYCSNCQENAVKKENLASAYQSKNIKGEDNPRWSGGTDYYNCVNCGKSVERHINDAEERYKNTFCSTDCLSEWRRGENHHQYIEESTTEYSENWFENRRKARSRDNNTCQKCAKSGGEYKDETGRELDVHHIIPARKFDDEKEADRLDNLITLCRSCHLKLEQE